MATGLHPVYANTHVTGQTSLYLMTLYFRTLIRRACGPVLNGTIGAFVNQGTQRYLSNVAISFTDWREDVHRYGELQVDEVNVVGALAYAHTASHVNTAALDGVDSHREVLVLELYDRAQSSNALSSHYSCMSDNRSIVEIASSSCMFSLTAEQTRGGAVRIRVRNSNGTEVAQVPYQVWYPLHVSGHVEDSQLDRLVPYNVCPWGGVYQVTRISAMAIFLADEPQGIGQLDVSSLVSFTSSSTSCVLVIAAFTCLSQFANNSSRNFSALENKRLSDVPAPRGETK